MCKLHGVRLIKGIKIFERMFYAKKPQLNSEQLLLFQLNVYYY